MGHLVESKHDVTIEKVKRMHAVGKIMKLESFKLERSLKARAEVVFSRHVIFNAYIRYNLV